MEGGKRTLDLSDISPHVRYVHICANAKSTTHQVPWRRIYDYELIFVVSGCLEVIYETGKFTVESHEIHMISPRFYHTVRVPDGAVCTYYSAHFDFVDLGRENDFSAEEIYISNCNRNLNSVPANDRLTRRPQDAPDGALMPKKTAVSDPGAYTLLFESMIRAQREKPFAWELEMKCAMLSLLRLTLTDCRRKTGWKSENRHMEHFSAIVAYLMNNCGENIDFEKVAQMFGYSYSTFRKRFKSECGKSPLQYLTELRMERAETLLSEGGYTVAETAYMVGYEDSSYFSRVFRKYKGRTPGSLSGRTKNP